MAFAAVTLRAERAGFAWGLAIPLIVFGLFAIAVGAAVGLRTALLLVGLGLRFGLKADWAHGVGPALILIGAMGFLIDGFAERRPAEPENFGFVLWAVRDKLPTWLAS